MLKLQAKGVAIWADEHHWTVHCVRSSEWSTFHLHLCISYQCIWGWQHLQKPSPKCHFTYIFCYFYFALGLHPWLCWLLDWSAHRSSAARDSFKRVHDWCKAGWRRPGGPPPKQKSWLRRWTRGSKQLSVTGLGDKSFSAINVHFEIGLDLYGWFCNHHHHH